MEKDNKLEEQELRGWADVQITPDMPFSVLINFMNVINQRLVAIENITQIPYENRMITLTELYRIQAEEEAKRYVEMEAEKMAEAEEKDKEELKN